MVRAPSSTPPASRPPAVEAERRRTPRPPSARHARSVLLAYGAPVADSGPLGAPGTHCSPGPPGPWPTSTRRRSPSRRTPAAPRSRALEAAQEAFADATSRATSAENAPRRGRRGSRCRRAPRRSSSHAAQRSDDPAPRRPPERPERRGRARSLERLDVAEQAEKAAYVVASESAAAGGSAALQRARLRGTSARQRRRSAARDSRAARRLGAPAVDHVGSARVLVALVAWAGRPRGHGIAARPRRRARTR